MGTNILRTCELFILQTLHETRYNRLFVLKNNGIFTLFKSTYVFQNPFLVILHRYAYVLYTQYSNTTYWIKNQQDATLAELFITNCKFTLHSSDASRVHHQEY